MLCSYLGIVITTAAKYRKIFQAITSLANAFQMTNREGYVMGFLLVSISLVIHSPIINIYNVVIVKEFSIILLKQELILVGKVEKNFPELSPLVYIQSQFSYRILAKIADNLGDMVGIRADLLGSFAKIKLRFFQFHQNNQEFDLTMQLQQKYHNQFILQWFQHLYFILFIFSILQYYLCGLIIQSKSYQKN